MELICEGACNPRLRQIDAMVAAALASRSDKSGGKISGFPVGDQGLWDLQATLIYTTHRTAGDTAECSVCGWLRRWGNTFGAVIGLDFNGNPVI